MAMSIDEQKNIINTVSSNINQHLIPNINTKVLSVAIENYEVGDWYGKGYMLIPVGNQYNFSLLFQIKSTDSHKCSGVEMKS